MNILLITDAEVAPENARVIAEISNAETVPRVGDIIALPEGYYIALSVVWDYMRTDGPQQCSINMKFLGEHDKETLQ